MKIDSSTLSMQSNYQAWQHDETRAQMAAWNSSSGNSGSPLNSLSSASARVSISQAARMSLHVETAHSADGDSSLGDTDAVTALIKSMVEMLTGRAIKTFSAADLPPMPDMPALQDPGQSAGTAGSASQSAAPPSSAGMSYDAYHLYQEDVQMNYSAEGLIRTGDGQEIRFSFEMQMERHYREESQVSVRSGSAIKKQDPLVVNFAGTAAQLSSRMIKFDLNGDGQLDNLPELLSGSAYLVLDRNQNGRIDNGNELFGPATNNGFAELAKLDADNNGWIDEADPLFSQLGLWSTPSVATPSADKTTGSDKQSALRSLSEAGIGALALARLATPFDLKEGTQPLGAVRETGLFLFDNGKPGSLQELDLVVQ